MERSFVKTPFSSRGSTKTPSSSRGSKGGYGSPVVKVPNRGWLVPSSSSVPLKTHRVEKRCTLNMSRPQSHQLRSRRHLTMVQNYETCVAWQCPDETQLLSCWPILAVSGQPLASNGPAVDSRGQNLVFGYLEATRNKLFLSGHTKCTAKPFWFGHRLSCFTALWLRSFSHNDVVCNTILISSHHSLKKWINFLLFDKVSQMEI
ncbi:hypothetical protein TNCV_4169381 [Trichonephila clavipes]|nr:hypothetical protein TNCV_4169381 [Trichonephila clavipes]